MLFFIVKNINQAVRKIYLKSGVDGMAVGKKKWSHIQVPTVWINEDYTLTVHSSWTHIRQMMWCEYDERNVALECKTS